MADPTECFNWVKARHECSVLRMFERLRLRAAADVDERNSIRADRRELEGSGLKFELQSNGSRFVIFRDGKPRGSVTFTLAGSEISIEGDNPPVHFVGAVTLNNQGQCRLRVGQEELEEWQVMKKALECLFFSAET